MRIREISHPNQILLKCWSVASFLGVKRALTGCRVHWLTGLPCKVPQAQNGT